MLRDICAGADSEGRWVNEAIVHRTKCKIKRINDHSQKYSIDINIDTLLKVFFRFVRFFSDLVDLIMIFGFGGSKYVGYNLFE